MKRVLFTAGVMLLATLASAQTQPEVVYSDDFQSYGIPADPPGWIDNPVGSPRRVADGLYKTRLDPVATGNTVYGTVQASGQPDGNTPRIGSFSTLTSHVFSARGRFEYSGRMIRTAADAQMGLTFLSSYAEADRYYLIGLWSQPTGGLAMQLFGFGAGAPSGTTTSTFVPTPNVWFRFRIQVDDVAGATNIRGRFWPDGTAEPSTFSIDATDTSPERLTSGGIGMWAAVRGDAFIDDVFAKSPVDHTPPSITLLESGNPLENGSKFNRDAVPEIRVEDDLSTFTFTASLDGSPFTSLTPVTSEGWHTLVVRAVDAPGNASETEVRFLVDKTPPVVVIREGSDPFPAGFHFNRDVVASADVADVSEVVITAALDGQPYVLGSPITGEGSHSITVSAADEVGWTTTAGPIAFTIDKTPPRITFTSHEDGQLLKEARAVVTGGSDDAVTVTVNGSATTLDAATRVFSSGTLPLLEGEQGVVASGIDRAGNVGTATLHLVVDTRAPALTMTSPASGSCVDTASLQVTGTAIDSRLQSVKVTAGAQSVQATVDAASGAWSATVPVAEGSVLVTVEATDGAGHTVSASRTVTIDQTAPVIDVRENGAVFSGGAFNRSVSFMIRSDDADANVTLASTLDGAAYISGSSVAAEGTHTLVVSATDCAGHTVQQSIDFTIDLTPPVIRDLVPPDGSTVGTMPASISGATDADATAVAIVAPAMSAAPAADGRFTIAAVPFAEGTNRFTLTARDAAGNSSSVEYSVRVKTTGPIVEIRESGSTMVSGTLFNRVVTPVIRASEADATIAATLNGAPFTSGTAVSNDGQYTLRATATDALGHSTTEEVTFSIDRTPPAVKITSPASGAAQTERVDIHGTAGDAVSAAVNGQPVALGPAGTFVLESVLLNLGPNPIVATARDEAGNIGRDEILLTREDLGSGIILTYPPDRSRTNRPLTDVVGRVLTPGRVTTVTIGTTAVPVDSTGGFRLSGYELTEGENTISAVATAANGSQSAAAARVTADFTPPSLTILAAGQPLSDGARFATEAAISLDASDAGGGAVTTSLTIDGVVATTLPSTITRTGGHAVIATATDLAGNQTRSERTLFIGTSSGAAGCSLGAFNPADGAVVLANSAMLVGRSGGAAGVKVNGIAAAVADGAFSATVELPAEGPNAIAITCTDADGRPTGTPATITLRRVTGDPSISITSPDEDFVSAEETIVVTGTVGAGVIAADVNGVAATISGTDTTVPRSFTVPAVRLAGGLNLLVARGRNGGGRSAAASRRGLYMKDAPAVQITSPMPNTTTGAPSITVSGTFRNLDPDSLTVENVTGGGQAAVQVVRTSDTTGRFTAVGVPLSSGEQTLRVSGRDRLNRVASASVAVRLIAGSPAISITTPADQSVFGGGSETVSVSGTFQAAEGSIVDVNGVGATLAGGSYTASAKFSALAGGVTPIVARVTEPGGASASAVITVRQLVEVPSVVESYPAPNAVEVDGGALLLVLFSQPMDGATMSGAFRLEDADRSPVSGSLYLDGDVLTFAPAALLTPGSTYTLRVTTAARNLAGTPLQADYAGTFTIGTTAPSNPPVLDPIGEAVCGQSITVSGTAAPGSRVRLEAEALILNGSADATGRFTFNYPLSGQSGFAVVRVRVVGSDGSLSPAAEMTLRVDCSGPQVLNASYDRLANRVTIEFSEPVDGSTLTVGAGNAILLTREDGDAVSGTASLLQKTATITPAQDLTARTFSVTVTTAVRDLIGNALVAPYTQMFATGGEQPAAGDGSGFISGEIYDATTGRPLDGVSIAIDVATPSPVTTTSDARGRYLARLPEGAHTIRASRAGYTSVWREIIVPAGAGVIPIDMRLTRRGAPVTAGGAAIALTHGGDTAVTRRVDLQIPAASVSTGSTVTLTAVGGQALPGLLPLGWSPLAAAEVSVEGSDAPAPLAGAQLAFHVPAAEVTASSQNLTLAHYDSGRDEWRVVVAVANVGAETAVVPVASSGAYALVYPDKGAALTPPPLPVAGDVLRGVAAAAADAPPLIRRDFQLDPAIVLPDGRAVATLRIEGDGASYPSGTAVQAYIDEELRLADGSTLLDPPFTTDLLLYRTLSGDLGVADFHLAPSPRAAQVVLETGVDRIRVFSYPGRLDRGTLVGSEGGPVPADDRISIEIPSGAVPEPLRATASSLGAADLQGIGPVAGFRVIGGFHLTLQRVTEPPPLDLDGDGTPDPAGELELFLPARATVTVDAAQLPHPTSQVILAELLDQTPFGRMLRLAVPMMPVDGAASTPVVRFTTSAIDRSVLAIDGVAREGRYVVLAAEAPIAFATGTVRSGSATGRLMFDARVLTPSLGVADVSRATGIYNVPVPAVPAAPFQLVPRHLTTGDGAAYTHAAAPAADAVVRVDLALVPQPPTLGAVVVLRGDPPSQATLTTGAVTRDVALTTNVRASFSPGIDPASITTDSIVVVDALTSSRVNGTASADGSVGVVWTLAAGELLKPNGRYLISISPAIRGANGASWGFGTSFTVETVTQILNQQVNRDRIRITIPDAAGVSRISGDPGALPAGWQAVAVRRGRDFKVRYQTTAAGDGSFAFFIGNGGDPGDRITIADLVDLQIINAAGNLAGIFPLTPFASEDGKSFVVPAGAAVRYTTPEGLTLDVPEGAFDVPTVITMTAGTKQEFLDIPSMEEENEFVGSVHIDFEGTAKKPLGFEAPIPAGFDTTGKQFILAQKMMSTRGPRLAVIDLMAVSGDKLVIDHGASTNASAIVVGSGLRKGVQQTLTGSKFTRYLRMLIASGIYSYHDIRQPVGGSVGWAVMEGLQSSYDLMWDLFASYYIPYIHVFERGGALLPIITGKSFTVVGIDPGTGLQAISRTYDPIPFGPPGTVTPVDPAEQNDGGPYPVFGSPFRVEMLNLDVEDVDIRSIRNFTVRLSNGMVTVVPGTPALDPAIKVTLLNVSNGTSMSGNAGSTLKLAAETGHRAVLLIEERQVDPTTPISIVFNEPIYVIDPNDREVVNLALRELIKVEHSPGPPGATPAYTDITRQVRFTTDSGERRVNMQLPSVLQSDAVYRVTLKANISDSVNGTPELTLGQGTVDNGGVLVPVGGGTALELHFTVRKPAGELGSFAAAPGGLIRGMDLSGNVLFVAAWDGGLHAYDVSNPAAMTGTAAPIGSIPGAPDTAMDHLSVTIDRHNRVYTTAHLPIAGLFRSYRVESFRGGYQQIPVKGSKIINWKLGYSSSIGLASNTILSDVPESIPFKIKVLLQDDETNFANRKAFVDGTGASLTGTYPAYDLEKFTVTVGKSGTPYTIQRITVENLTLDMRWSADATDGGPAVIPNVVARSTDRLRLLRNQKTFAIVSHLGYGVGVYDANAIESNRQAGLTSGAQGSIREQLVLTAGLIRRDCTNPTPEYGIVEGYLPTDAEMLVDAADGTVYTFSADPHRGVLDLKLRIPSDQAPGTRDDDCDQRPKQGSNTGGLLFRSTPAGSEAQRMKDLQSAFSAAAGRVPIGHVSGMARYFWSVSAQDNPLGMRGTIPQQRAERDYLLVAAHEWGLVVVDVDSWPAAVSLYPLTTDNIADIIWIPGGVTSVRVYQSANIAVVGDRYGRALVVDLSRIDERWDEKRNPVSGLFPTAKKALAGPANDPFGVGADDPRIIWKSEPGVVSGSVAPVFDPYTGMLFAGNALKVKVVSALDPRVTMKVNLGAGAGLSDVGGVVPLGVPLPRDIEQRVAALPACDGTTLACRENASLAAFRLEVSLPGDMTESLTSSGSELWLAVESERVAGAITEQTPDGFPRSHLRRSRRDGSAEIPGRAATKFKFTRIVPDDLRPVLKDQRGYNRFISPWIVAVADPRGSEDYEWQEASNRQQKKEAGCDECERPDHLKNKTEDDGVFELWTNGRFITVRPELLGASSSIFAGTRYSYLGTDDRLLGRFSTVMADTVRPTEVLVAGQNPPVATGALEETTFLHSGEVQTGTVDLDGGGRAGFNVLFDRAYRSRTLGGTVFGQGWDSSILRRLRALPNGEVEFRDGAEVYRFRPNSSFGGYDSPKGLFLKLSRTGNGWRLIDQSWRIAEFDDLGRLVSESDEFYDPQTPDSGNIIRYVYDESGRLADIVDPVRRRSQLSYWKESEAGAAGAYPGLVKQIVDWRNRRLDFVYDASAGTLVRVQLPDVPNTTGSRPAVEYTYSPAGGSYTDQLELRTNLESVKDPQQVAASGPARVTFTYDTGGGFRRDRVLTQKWGTGQTATFTWDSRTAAAVTDALGQSRQYVLSAEPPKSLFDDRPHVKTVIENAVTVSSTPFGTLPSTIAAGIPPTTSANRTTSFTYDDEGQIETETLEGVRSITRTYTDVRPIAPGFIPRTVDISPAAGPTAAVSLGLTYQSGATASTFVQSVSANGESIEMPEPSRAALTLDSSNDSINSSQKFDSNGLPSETASSGGTDPGSAGSNAETHWGAVTEPEHVRGKLKSIEVGGLKTTIQHVNATQSVATDPRGVVTTKTVDAWDRPASLVVAGPQLTVNERFEYDATGRPAKRIRLQGGKTITETLAYDVMGRPTRYTIDQVAGVGTAVTTIDHSPDGRTITTTFPSGAVRVLTLDSLGRTVRRTMTTGTSGSIEDHFAYDLLDNVVFRSDLFDASAEAFDGHGQLVGTMGLDGIRTRATVDAWGRVAGFRKEDAAGQVLAESTLDYTPSGRLRSVTRKLEGTERVTSFAWDGGGRPTGMSVAGRAQHTTYDSASRIQSRQEGAGSATSVSTAYRSAQISSHSGSLPQQGTTSEKGGPAYSLALQYNTLGHAVGQGLGNLDWRRNVDQAGNVTMFQAPGKGARTFDFDSRRSLTTEVLADGATNTYGYHPTGALASYTDPSSEVTETINDLGGRPVQRKYKDGTEELITWEGRRVKSITDRQQRVQSFVYNERGQIAEVRSGSGDLVEKFEYDDAGRIIRWSNADAVLEYSDFDSEGHPRKTSQSRLRDGDLVDKYTQEHTWNIHGERSSWTMPTYQGFSSMNPWTTLLTKQYDAMGNVARIERTLGAGGGSLLLDADYRDAGRPIYRRISPAGSSTVLARDYGYDGANGLLNRMAVVVNGKTVAGSEVEYEGVQKVRARLLGLSGNLRSDEWIYDARNRLKGSKLAMGSDATPQSEDVTAGDFRAALIRPTGETPADPLTIQYTENGNGGHKIKVMQRGLAIEEFIFNGGERIEDGRFHYEYDAKGRLITATAKDDSTVRRRTRYSYDPRGRLVGRRAEYAVVAAGTSPQPGDWRLEDRPEVLAAEALPADTTFVWDPMSDQLVAMFQGGSSEAVSTDANGGLIRQIIHGGLGYDDPVEIAAADPTAQGGISRLYPIYDEAGGRSLQVVLNQRGQIVARSIAAGPYGEDQAVLSGPAVDEVSVGAKKDDAGNLEAVEFTLRSTEQVAAASLAGGFRLAVVDAEGEVVRTSSIVPRLEGDASVKWALTREEWDALTSAGGVAVSVAATSDARGEAWGESTRFLAAPTWAVETRPVFSSAALPIEVRESLANLSQWLASIPAGEAQDNTIYEVPNLYALAAPRIATATALFAGGDPLKFIVASPFHAHPFQDPFTGQNYVRARWFDLHSGAWLTPDPAGYVDSPNLYAYAGGDPVNSIDSTGRNAEGDPDPPSKARRFVRWLAKEAVATAIEELTPVGIINGVVTAATGYDVVRGEEVEGWLGRGLALASALPLVPSAIRKIDDIADAAADTSRAARNVPTSAVDDAARAVPENPAGATGGTATREARATTQKALPAGQTPAALPRSTLSRHLEAPSGGLPAGIDFEGFVYRGGSWRIHPGNLRASHRYSSPGRGALYTSLEARTAASELRAYGVDLSTATIEGRFVRASGVLDLTDASTRKQLGVSLEQLTSNDYGITENIGDWARALGYSGILAPSARRSGGRNLVLFGGVD